MDESQILNRIEAHEKQKSNLKAIIWRKSLHKKLTKKQVREKAIKFFANDKLSSNHKTIEKAIKSIEMFEKQKIYELKVTKAHEEYNKLKTEPKKNANYISQVKVPPASYASPHIFRKDSTLQKFQCKCCYKEFNTKKVAIEHMENAKLRTDSWLQSLDSKLKEDKRLAHFYGSPAVIKHLTVETLLPNPDIDSGDNDFNDVTLAPEDGKYQPRNQKARMYLFQSSGECLCAGGECLEQNPVASPPWPTKYQEGGIARHHKDQYSRGQVWGECYYERGGNHSNKKSAQFVSFVFVC